MEMRHSSESGRQMRVPIENCIADDDLQPRPPGGAIVPDGAGKKGRAALVCSVVGGDSQLRTDRGVVTRNRVC